MLWPTQQDHIPYDFLTSHLKIVVICVDGRGGGGGGVGRPMKGPNQVSQPST